MISSDTRERNRRGEGGLLRAEILHAAAGLLETTGNEDAITLRAVARQVGISAPAIYAHFADRDEIIAAVVDAAFAEFIEALRASIADISDPVQRLRTGCRTYLAFAEQRPSRYRVLFELRPGHDGPAEKAAQGKDPTRTAAFTILVDCVQACIDAGSSPSTDAFRDATAIWVGLHGYATLRAGIPQFPWPDHDAVVDRLVLGLSGTEQPGNGKAPA